MNAVKLFESPDLINFAGFAKTMSDSGAGGRKWRELHQLLVDHFLPAREEYFDALKRAQADRANIMAHIADAEKRRPELAKELASLDEALASIYPAHLAAADAAPAAIAVKANKSLDAGDVARITAAFSVYVEAFKA